MPEQVEPDYNITLTVKQVRDDILEYVDEPYEFVFTLDTAQGKVHSREKNSVTILITITK